MFHPLQSNQNYLGLRTHLFSRKQTDSDLQRLHRLKTNNHRNAYMCSRKNISDKLSLCVNPVLTSKKHRKYTFYMSKCWNVKIEQTNLQILHRWDCSVKSVRERTLVRRPPLLVRARQMLQADWWMAQSCRWRHANPWSPTCHAERPDRNRSTGKKLKILQTS